MKLLFGFFLAIVLSINVAAQERYAYSFSGEIDSSFVKQLEEEVMLLDGVQSAKAKYKIQKRRGEIIISSQLKKGSKNPYVFSPVEIKAILQRHNLVPGELILLTSHK